MHASILCTSSGLLWVYRPSPSAPPPTPDHFILENFCVAFKRNLLETHPLYPLIMAPCRLNAGVLKDGISVRAQKEGSAGSENSWEVLRACS